MMANAILILVNPYIKITISELPIFKPNAFFFENHQREGEQPWETYMRVMREIIAEHGNFKLTDVSI